MNCNGVFNKSGSYCRYFTDELSTLTHKVKSIYNSNYAYVFNSGLNANYVSIDILLGQSKDSIIIYPSESYFENIQIIQYIKKIYKIEIYEFDILNTFQLYKLLNLPQHKILFLESCMNPSGYIFDFSLINEIKQYNTSIIIDNTWLSGHIFNPLINVGADIVTESITKYYSANTEIAGISVFNNDNYNNLFDEYIRFTGLHISPVVIETINGQINNIIMRLHKISNLVIYTINYLLNNNIKCVHPCLIDHPSCYNYYKYFNNKYIVGTFLIGFNCDKDNIIKMMDKIKIFEIKSSFCYCKTIINKTIYKIKNSNLNFIRLSIGYDDDYHKIICGINELMYMLNII
jgi:cystathionine beta-lyase/cystathionine gamma-synthase